MEKVCFGWWLGGKEKVIRRGNIYMEFTMCGRHLECRTHTNLLNPHNHFMD